MKITSTSSVLLALATLASTAHAGVTSDDLNRCFIRAATEADQLVFIRWFVAAASQHPAVKSLAAVNEAMRDSVQKDLARVAQRLLTVDCRTEAELAIKADGREALQSSFGAFGQMAGAGLFSAPAVASEAQGFLKYVDREALRALMVDR